MSDGSDRFVDEATGFVLGVGDLRERLAPDGEAGRLRAKHPRTYRPGDREAWLTELEALETVERWSDAHPDDHDALRSTLSQIPRIDDVIAALRSQTTLTDEGLFGLKQFCFYGAHALEIAADLVEALDRPSRWRSRLVDIAEAIHPDGTDTPRFHLSGELDPDLADLLERQRRLQEELQALRDDLEAAILDNHGGRFDLQGVFRPATEVDEATLEADDALTYRAGGWRPASEELERREAKLEEVRADIDAAEHRVRQQLTATLAGQAGWLGEVADFLAELDVRLAKVRLKGRLDGCWGRWLDEEDPGAPAASPHFALSGGRDPQIADRLRANDAELQPVDFALGDRPAVVTGPNMGGKSALLRLAGLSHWCAQHAMPVPADAFAFRPVAGVVYVGSEEPSARDASHGLSSFGREVRRLVDAREAADPPTLWLLDEVGRGTHPADGAELAIDVIAQLHAAGHSVMAATHFPAVAACDDVETYRIRGITEPNRLEEVLGGAVDVDEIALVLGEAMDYQPVAAEGGEVPRDARLVARALGLG